MTYNTSITSYIDIRAALDKALESEKGVRLRFPDAQAAMTFKGRFHSFRSLDRKENMKIYEVGHPMYGRSVYDVLMSKSEDERTVAVIKAEGVEYDLEEIK